LQFITLKKILEIFKTLLIAIIKIEIKLSLVDLRLQQKCDKYAIRLAMLAKNHSTKICIFSFFISQYNIETKINEKRYLD